ncbi:prolyl oligopeptidase family serine peptidase [Trueperella pecoris]|uniref:Prolyl oligopeptidase family serine peptidase n=1 Tax=Trueperella pecoris TaxID=2733571 RepID=A0A7M1QXQ6_9ACTO|nr:prolyl oligopeptidase family serine peptidase [Trueperella pecoris]QOR46809.1 prolyl oligopeptidase family serine peptidase [Trueperella pecoris]
MAARPEDAGAARILSARTGARRRVPLVLTWVLAVLVLGAWGAWAGPGWNPQPMTNLIVPQTASTAIVSAVNTPRLGAFEVASSIHEVALSDGQKIQVTLREPVGKEGQSPAIVFLHGTGTFTHKAFAQHATWLASTGIVTAVPDKLLNHYSAFERDYVGLSKEYQAVATWLRAQGSVYAREVGYYGESEGALIAPIAVVNDADAAFLVLVSDPAMPIREQGAFAADAYLRKLGAPSSLYQAIPRLISGAIADGNFLYATFDPGPYHERITVPVMMAYGTKDLSMPIVQGPIRVAEDLKEAGNDDLVLRYYKDADHGLRIDKELQSQPYQDISDFINGLPSSVRMSPAVAGAQPRQDYTAQTLDTPRWFGSGDAMAAILASGLMLTLLGSLLMIGGRLPWARRQTYRGVGRPILASGVLITLTWLAFLTYVMAVARLALSYETNRWVVQGGALGVQMLGLLALFFLVFAASRWYARPMLTRHAGASLRVVVTGQILLLFALAYWGIYPSPFF